jgi:two-component system chemotaxis response regulator CheB
MLMAVHETKDGRRIIRVVVGEDSPLMQALIVRALQSEPTIRVVATCADGREVLRKTSELRPDCITLDLEMPNMDGLETLRYLMSEWPTPVVVVSAHTEAGAKLTFTCLEYGAVDFVSKGKAGGRFPTSELIAKVKAASAIDVRRVKFEPAEVEMVSKPREPVPASLRGAVVIGASTGGPQALMEIVPRLPRDLQAGIVIVQHMPPNFTRYLAERLDARSKIEVVEAEEGDLLLPGRAIVAPGGMHLLLEERGERPAVMLLAKNALQRTACPSVDFALCSFAPIFKERLVAVILTGMGRDGAAGCASVRQHGGRVICQDRESSLIFGMPGAVVGEGLADAECPVGEIADCIANEARRLGARELAHERQ